MVVGGCFDTGLTRPKAAVVALQESGAWPVLPVSQHYHAAAQLRGRVWAAGALLLVKVVNAVCM